jgi:hypothetical protein
MEQVPKAPTPAPEQPFGDADDHPFIVPLEAAQWVQHVSGGKLNPDEAGRELEKALAAGRLVGIGEHSASNGPQAVPREIWAHHELDLLGGATRARVEPWRHQSIWPKIIFRRADVLQLWPSLSGTREAELPGREQVGQGELGGGPRSDGSTIAKRGPKHQWDWKPIVVEAKIAFARSEGEMTWKELVGVIMDLAEKQTGHRPKSDSTAGELAAQIREEWGRYIEQPAN